LLKPIVLIFVRKLVSFQILTRVACVPGKNIPAYGAPAAFFKQAEEQEILLELEGVEQFLGLRTLWGGFPN